MSWAEDNNIDLGYDPRAEQRADMENDWRKGNHTTKDGRSMLVKDMDINHLKNTIKHFEDYDVSPLEKELRMKTLEAKVSSKCGEGV